MKNLKYGFSNIKISHLSAKDMSLVPGTMNCESEDVEMFRAKIVCAIYC